MKKVLTLVLISVIAFPIAVILINSLTPPKPIEINGKKSLVLTHTTLSQLFQPKEVLGLVFNETNRNPYIYGWSEDDLYYKNAFNQDFVLLAGEKKPKKIKVDHPQFLKQEEKSEKCDPDNIPDYKVKNYPGNIYDACFVIEQTGIRIESWMYEFKNLLAINVRHLVIIKDGRKYIFNQPRKLSDLVISESGKYLALTISDPINYPGFDATNIQVIELP